MKSSLDPVESGEDCSENQGGEWWRVVENVNMATPMRLNAGRRADAPRRQRLAAEARRPRGRRSPGRGGQAAVVAKPTGMKLVSLGRSAGKMIVIAALVVVVIWLGTSGLKQIVLRPYHVLAHVVNDPPLAMMGTWKAYQHIFYRFETEHLSATFLGVLAHELSGGQSWSVVPWHIQFSIKPWGMIQPTHDKFGIMQFSSAGFEQALGFCLSDHQPVTRKRWYKFGGCAHNRFKTRGSVSHSVEVAAASMQWFIHHHVLAYDRQHTLKNLRDVAVIRHLCGDQYGERFIHNEFNLEGIYACQGKVMHEFLEVIHDGEFKLRGQLRQSAHLPAPDDSLAPPPV